MVWVAPQGSATMIKSSFLDRTQVRKSEPQIPKTKFLLRLLSTSASFNLLLGRTQESDPLRQDTPAREKEETPSENQTTKAESWMLVCDTQFILTSRLPRANVWNGNAIPGSKITIFPKRSTEQFHIALITNSASYQSMIYFQKFSNTLGSHPNLNNQSSLHSRTK